MAQNPATLKKDDTQARAPKSKAEVIQQLLAIATMHDDQGNPGLGDDIRALINEINSNQRDHNSIKIEARVTLDKFDGEKVDDSQVPVETTEYVTEL